MSCIQKIGTNLLWSSMSGMPNSFSLGAHSLAVAFKGPNVILGLYKYNFYLTRGKELGTAAGQKQGAWPNKTRWRAGFSLWTLCLPPVPHVIISLLSTFYSPSWTMFLLVSVKGILPSFFPLKHESFTVFCF